MRGARDLCAIGAAVALAVAVFAIDLGGRTAVAGQPATADGVDASVAGRLVRHAGRLRELAATDPGELMRSGLDGTGPANIDLSLPDATPAEMAALWSYFFAYAQVFPGLAGGDQPIAGYYNPLVDYWYFILWGNDGHGTMRPQASWVLPGQFLISPDTADTASLQAAPPWLRAAAATSFAKSLELYGSEASRAFRETYPLAATAPALPVTIPVDVATMRRTLRDRLAYFVSDVIALLASESLRFTYETTLTALKRADRGSLGRLLGPHEPPVPIAAILTLPAHYRTRLAPAALLMAGKDRIVLSGRADDSSWFLVTHFYDRNGSAELKAVSYVDAFPEIDRVLPGDEDTDAPGGDTPSGDASGDGGASGGSDDGTPRRPD